MSQKLDVTDFDNPTSFSSSSERTQWYKQQKLIKRKHQKQSSAAKRKELDLQHQNHKGSTTDSRYSKRHDRRLRKAVADQTKRENAKERKRTERLKNKMAANALASGTDNSISTFKHRMDKKRAIERLKNALPLTPKRRTATLAAYLEKTTSPTVHYLQSGNIVTKKEDRTDTELAKQVLHNIKETITKSKHKRTDEKRAEMHTILASVSVENISQSKAKTNLAKRLGVSVKRISGGNRLRGKIVTSEKSCWYYTKKKTRSDKISDETKKLIYDFWMSPGISRPTGNKRDVKRHRTGPKCYISHPIHILEKTQTDVYEDFLHAHPCLAVQENL